MLSTIEKVLFLKTVNLFMDTPAEILNEIATLLTEVDLPKGKTLFNKGEPGDCLYIIVSGKVMAHDGDYFLNNIQEGQIFGEMALLDPKPRLNAITAVEDTHLLRLVQEPFYELMEDRIEVARGIIQVLSLNLRNRVREISALTNKVQKLEA